MKSSAGCFKQIVIFVATLIVVSCLWAGWEIVRLFLARQGVPSWILTLGAILFFLWIMGAIMKVTIILAFPKSAKLVQASVKEITGASQEELLHRPPIVDPADPVNDALPLDAGKLVEWDAALQSLGFRPLTDFYMDSTMSVRGFARLFVSEEHQCRAELNQVFSQTMNSHTTSLKCVFISVMADNQAERWSLSTFNGKKYKGSGLEWAMRSPHGLWSRHSDWTLAQLLSFHLERRAQIMQTLQLSLATDLSWDGFCADGNFYLQDRRKRLLRKPGILIWYENIFCKNKTEWWGDFRKHMNANNASITNVT